MASRPDEVIVNGTNIRVTRIGSGPPLLVLHDMMGAPERGLFLDMLAQEHELVIPDHPGFGASDTPAWLRNMGDMALFYLDFLERVDLEGVPVLGLSLGAWIAAEVAVRNPRALGRMSWIAPAGLRTAGVETGDVFLWNAGELASNMYFDQSLAEQQLNTVKSPEVIETELKNRYTTARLAWEPRFFNPDLERWVHRIKPPVQLIWGENDQVIPHPYAAAWQARLPDCQLHTMPRCGHLPHIEYPEATAAAVRSSLVGASQ